ncbi:MAG: adenosylcobinamide-GDP ribazoletransferase, partial [Devosia sp.]
MSDETNPLPRPHNDNEGNELGARLLDDLIMGVRFYSRLPMGDRLHQRPNLSRIALALPFASLVIGLAPALLLLVLDLIGTPTFFAAALAVALSVIVTGAMAEDALADAADGLFGGHDVDQRLAIMKDSRHGTYGVAAIALLLLLRATALGSIPNPLEAVGVW